jgi:hypothetical protein
MEELTLRGFENRMLRRISEPTWEEVVGTWKRLHNEELHNLYTSLNYFGDQSQEDGMYGYVVNMGKMRNAYNILVGKHEGKRQLGRPRHR